MSRDEVYNINILLFSAHLLLIQQSRDEYNISYLIILVKCSFLHHLSPHLYGAGMLNLWQIPHSQPRFLAAGFAPLRAGTFLGNTGRPENPFRRLNHQIRDFFGLCKSTCIKYDHSDSLWSRHKTTFLSGGGIYFFFP